MNFNTHLASESTIVGHKPSHTIISAFAPAAAAFGNDGSTVSSDGINNDGNDQIFEMGSIPDDDANIESKIDNDNFEDSALPNYIAKLSAFLESSSGDGAQSAMDTLKNCNTADLTSILSKAKKTMDEKKSLGAKAWGFLTSAVPVFGIRIPGFLIAFIAAIAAKFFSCSIVVCGILFGMVQCLIAVQEKNTDTMRIGPIDLKQLYKSRSFKGFIIPGWLIAALTACITIPVTLYFSGTIVNGILAGLLCWIIYSVWQTYSRNRIVDDLKSSAGDAENLVNHIIKLCQEKKMTVPDLLKKSNESEAVPPRDGNSADGPRDGNSADGFVVITLPMASAADGPQ